MADGFANSILGGAETLIRSAIRSANYVAGLAGWRIAKDGSAELNSATIRGSLIAGSGNVTVDSTGLHVITVDSLLDVDRVLGLEARHNPDDGSIARLQVLNTVSPANGFAGALILGTNTPTSPNSNVMDHGFVASYYTHSGATDLPFIIIKGPSIHGLNFASIQLGSQTSTSAIDDSTVLIQGQLVANRYSCVANIGTPSIANSVVQSLVPASFDLNVMGIGTAGSALFNIPSGVGGLQAPGNIWRVGCTLRFATNATGQRMARILLNGVELTSFPIPTVAGFNTTVAVETTTALSPGDQLQFAGFQNSGAALSLVGNGNRAWIMQELG